MKDMELRGKILLALAGACDKTGLYFDEDKTPPLVDALCEAIEGNYIEDAIKWNGGAPVGHWESAIEKKPDEGTQILVELDNLETPWMAANYINGEFTDWEDGDPIYFVKRWAYVNTDPFSETEHE